MRVCVDQEPFYRNNATNYQTAMEQFMDIIKHVGANIQVLNVDTGDDGILAGYNLYTFETTDGTELKALSSNVVENVLTACSSLQKLSIKRTKFIDCRENGLTNNTLKTIGITNSSRFANDFLTRLSTRAPNLQDVKLEIDNKEIISSSGELYDIVIPFTHFRRIEVNTTFDRDNDSSRTDQDVNVKLVTNKIRQ